MELATTEDPDGKRVVLDESGWDHICRNHPELQRSQAAIMAVLPNADHRERDLNYEKREWFWRSGGFGPANWLGVLVDYEGSPARIVTSYGQAEDPPGWL